MSISQQRRDLFKNSNALDTLALIQILLDSRDLDPDAAFALLNTVHSELRQPGRHDSRVYIRYGEIIGSLHRQMPHVYNEVIARWEASHLGLPKQDSDKSTQELSEEEFEEESKGYAVPHRSESFPNVEKAHRMTSDAGTVEIGGGTEEELEIPEAEEEGEETEEKETSEEEAKEERAEMEEEDETEKEEKEEPELEENEEEKEEAEEEEESREEDSEDKEEKGENAETEEESEEQEKEVSEEETEIEEVEESKEEQEAKEEIETGTETESAAEADKMATEAAEASEHMEEQEATTPEVFEEESETEEEPPIEGAE